MDIRHDEKEQRFYIQEQGKECALQYKELSEKLWNFVSTSVPDDFSGKAIMDRMIEFAIDFVKQHNIKILASCSDVQDFLIRHKDLKDLVYHPY
jgi:predicted GNAT family acetyltransferase